MKTDKGIHWDKAWSLIDGCTPVSAACDNCRLKAMPERFGNKTFDIPRLRADRLDIPLKTKKPTVFAIWSDLFHESVPADFIIDAFEVMDACSGEKILTPNGYKTYPRHTFLICTKRPERLESVLYGQEGSYYLGGGDEIPQNVYLGATIENQKWADERIPHLLKIEGKKWLSVEPLIEKIYIETYLSKGISQVIVGAESGHHRRECKIEWIESIVEQCKAAGVPCFVKQIHLNGKLIKDINQFPESVRVRELAWMHD